MSDRIELPEGVSSVEILRPQPGDTIIVRTRDKLTARDAQQIKEQVTRLLPFDFEMPVLVLSDGIVMQIARPVPAGPQTSAPAVARGGLQERSTTT